jgi:hypothetical protein
VSILAGDISGVTPTFGNVDFGDGRITRGFGDHTISRRFGGGRLERTLVDGRIRR